MTSAVSVKDRLKNQAAASGKTMQEALTAYGLERTIYRLSISEYMERFTLKGGVFLYALFDGEFARATSDIDLLAKNMPNNVEDMARVFEDIFSIQCDDALRYDLSTLEIENITEFKEYHGVNVSIMAYLDRTRVPISVDIGFGDVIYPERVKMEFPVLLDMKAPEIYAYSILSVIAEKFEAIVSLGDANSMISMSLLTDMILMEWNWRRPSGKHLNTEKPVSMIYMLSRMDLLKARFIRVGGEHF